MQVLLIVKFDWLYEGRCWLGVIASGDFSCYVKEMISSNRIFGLKYAWEKFPYCKNDFCSAETVMRLSHKTCLSVGCGAGEIFSPKNVSIVMTVMFHACSKGAIIA